jgi:hypothetical protein
MTGHHITPVITLRAFRRESLSFLAHFKHGARNNQRRGRNEDISLRPTMRSHSIVTSLLTDCTALWIQSPVRSTRRYVAIQQAHTKGSKNAKAHRKKGMSRPPHGHGPRRVAVRSYELRERWSNAPLRRGTFLLEAGNGGRIIEERD